MIISGKISRTCCCINKLNINIDRRSLHSYTHVDRRAHEHVRTSHRCTNVARSHLAIKVGCSHELVNYLSCSCL